MIARTEDVYCEYSQGNIFMPTVRSNDVEIYYEVHGQGQPFLFLSETACSGEVWKLHQLAEFAKDHTVIIHDYRGTGRSSKPQTNTRPGCFATMP